MRLLYIIDVDLPIAGESRPGEGYCPTDRDGKTGHLSGRLRRYARAYHPHQIPPIVVGSREGEQIGRASATVLRKKLFFPSISYLYLFSLRYLQMIGRYPWLICLHIDDINIHTILLCFICVSSIMRTCMRILFQKRRFSRGWFLLVVSLRDRDLHQAGAVKDDHDGRRRSWRREGGRW